MIITASKLKPTLYSILIFSFLLGACSEILTNDQIGDSLDPVDDVSLVTDSNEIEVTVQKGAASMFELQFSGLTADISWKDEIHSWCIDWQKPINSDGGQYSGLKLYTTFNVESWKPVNFLLNQVPALYEQHPGITFREIQLAVWSLRGFPKFKLSEIDLSDLPPRFLTNGEPAFNADRVDEIISFVNSNYRDFEYSEDLKYAIIVETPADVQTIIAVVN